MIHRQSFVDSDYGQGVLAQTKSKKMFGEDRESLENTINSKKGLIVEWDKLR